MLHRSGLAVLMCLALCVAAGTGTLAAAVNDAVVQEIRIQGNRAIGREEIVRVMALKPGSPLSRAAVVADVKHIEALYQRTSKTADGAQRRGVILTVLASLATRFERFTLDNLLCEVTRWWETGLSIFEQELAKLHQTKIPPILPAET